MTLFLKNILSWFTLPLSWVVVVLATGLALSRFSKKMRAGRLLMSAGFLILFLFSIRPTALLLLAPLEGRYPAYAGQPVDFVVVLGGGQYSEASSERLFEGIRIKRLNPESRLVLSGAPCGAPVSEADVLAARALALGVPASEIILEPCSRVTCEHPLFVKPLVAGRPFAVVTSASHMHRAVRLFKKAGLNPVPAPAGSLSLRLNNAGRSALAPNISALSASSAAFHEYFGLLWAYLRGQI
ncbi:MAG: YdcF family protein [Deltaproteobacteria bacterium]|nr:YdcF family protein [Deltaproteobacteria bacterium]